MKLIAPNKENHKALWHWLGDHPVRTGGYFTDKEDWPGFKTMIDHFITTPAGLCFACEECEGMCLICPVEWKGCTCMVGYFHRWELSSDSKQRAKLAHKIAEAWK